MEKRAQNVDGRIWRRLRWAALSLLVLAGGCSHGNLLGNPSFEELKLPDQFGRAFQGWGGWVYDQPARLGVGNVAHTGAHSFELSADKGGKVRLLSEKKRLAAGRYRLTLYLRGLSLAADAVDYSLGFDGKFHTLQLAGSFGWTPVHHVFELKKPVENFQLAVGLKNPGWLWIDDVSLEEVGNEPLTTEPVIAAAEGPAAPLAKSGKSAVHCPECGYRNNRGSTSCYACGHDLQDDAGSRLPAVRTLADFEDGGRGPVKGGRIVTVNPLDGKSALASSSLISINGPQDWSGYQSFRFEVYNPSDIAAPIRLEVRDQHSKGYWTRVNYETVAPPGKSTVTLPTDLYVGEKSRPGRRLELDKITDLFIDPKGKELVFDNLRLERVDAGGVTFEGLQAFDFGKAGSPVMEGFRKTTAAMSYEPGRGFGWDKADIWKSVDALQPDALYQDFICPRSGSFRVDLPDGRYRVIMNIDSPNGYWGEVPAYTHRRVLANGVAVVNEELDFERFKRRHYRNAAREDLPGLDPFKEYVQRQFQVKEFEVNVTGGKLELTFDGDGYAISLSTLVIYPASEREKGKKFWDWVTERRRAQFADYFKQIRAKATGSRPAEGEYALFSRYFMKPVNAFDGPLPGEAIGQGGVEVAAALGEEAPATFSVQPSLTTGNLGVEVTPLRYEGGAQAANRPSPQVEVGWLDYRITRVTGNGSVYTVAPRYWRPLPAASAPGVTRTFWLRVKVPAGTPPGRYRATVEVQPKRGRSSSFPLTVNVLPFGLDPITDVAVGPWGNTVPMPWLAGDPARKEWDWQMLAQSLETLREAGATTFSWAPKVRVSAEGGRIRIEAPQADSEMELFRSKGFNGMVSAYGGEGLGYRMYGDESGPDLRAARGAGFPDADSYLKALYKAVDKHASMFEWLPVAWNICDEPMGEGLKGATLNAQAHRRAAQGLKLTTFMGATSLEGVNRTDPHFELVKALLVPALNKHDRGSLEAVNLAGNRLSFYNNDERWTYGRYLKMLVLKHRLALRLGWHFNNTAGDPYYALDCREDDYCWFNSNSAMEMVPSVTFLTEILPGLNDYRYLSTLQRLLNEKPHHPAAPAARKVFEAMLDLEPGRDLHRPGGLTAFEVDRAAVAAAIQSLLAPGK